VTHQLTQWIAQYGAIAIFLIMAVDAVLPAGGEITMLFAGVAASSGGRYVEFALAGTLGYLAGSMGGWLAGRRLSRVPANLDRAEEWFDRYGSWAIFLGRLTPVVRSFISVPAGALGAPLRTYVPLTALASALWCFGFAAVGYAVGNSYESVHHAFHYVDVIAVAVSGVVIVLALAHRVRRRRRTPA
jgi:membrane protein DedA with SNARE-associated domain